ncbi:MAG: LysM peptidoglycan-binding domain-containing protein [Methylococcales bacterium]|nr:LysM peptidoglycan-binding domain-containing protein [Methylococcales bacterium]
MKQLPIIIIIGSVLSHNIQLSQANPFDLYIDTIRMESHQKSMKSNFSDTITNEEPKSVEAPKISKDKNTLSKVITYRLEQILTGSSSKKIKQKEITQLISAAIHKDHKITNIQRAFKNALVELNKQTKPFIKSESLAFAKKTIHRVIETNRIIAQDNLIAPYIKSLNSDADNTSPITQEETIIAPITKMVITKKNSSPRVRTIETNLSQPTVESIIVKKGDTLYNIAKRLYGSKDLYRLLYKANRSTLNTPNQLKLGQVLIVPPLPFKGIF